MRNSRFSATRALLLGSAALAVATAACSRGDLSAAERETMSAKSPPGSSDAVVQAPIQPDSSSLFDVSARQSQTRAGAPIEDILKSSPLKNPKADCATPVAGAPNPGEVGVQCPTDAPAKN